MSKFLGYFLTSMVFIIGIAMGMYFGMMQENAKNKDIISKDEVKNIVPVQDVVMRNVQQEKNEEKNMIETTIEETKLSPYAKMVIEKKFIKCGHTSVDVVDIPQELINMTKKDIMQKYENWEIRAFNSKEVSLYMEVNANCNDHFVLKDKDGYLAIYNEVNEDVMNLKEITDVDISSLPSGDIEKLQEGIYVYGKDNLLSAMEDFNS